MKVISCKNLIISKVNGHNFSQKSYGRRMTSKFELDYITEANGGVMITNEVPTKLEKGMLFFRTPGMSVEGMLPYSCYFIHFDSDALNFLMPSFTAQSNGIQELFEKIFFNYTHRTDDAQFLIDFSVNEILLRIYQAQNSFALTEGLTTAEAYLRSNLTKNLTLDQLANKAGYSKYRFCHLFRERYGTSPMKYVDQLRMGEVSQLLIETGHPIKRIMLDCGFHNEAIFFRKFKAFTRMTPKEYRYIHRIGV